MEFVDGQLVGFENVAHPVRVAAVSFDDVSPDGLGTSVENYIYRRKEKFPIFRSQVEVEVKLGKNM